MTNQQGKGAAENPRGLADAVVAVVGGGAMGAGIAEVAARAGHPVRLIDLNPEVLARSRAGISRNLDGLVAKGRLDAGERDAALGRISWHGELAAVRGAGLVVEAIVERMDAKSALLRDVETLVYPSCIIGTNTSSLSVTRMAEALVRPGRFIGLHFFNPVPAMKLVEIVPGPATAEGLAVVLSALMEAWGKTPVVVQDVPGFIVNRLARPYYGEAFQALDEGVDPAAVDMLLVQAGGFRMGPLALSDMIGHDINYAAAVSVFEGYRGETRFRPQPRQSDLVQAGRLGRKAGRGVFDYGSDPTPADQPAPGKPSFPGVVVPAISGDLDPILARLRQVQLSDVDPALAPGTLRIGDRIVALSDGRPLTQRDGVDVILDYARDFGTATALGFAARDDRAAEAAAGFLMGLGLRPVRLPDRPGLVVLRVLVQLAASALDGLDDRIASADDIGLAMRLGANHPESPLDWLARIGVARLRALQSAIAAATGDAIYAPDRVRHPQEISA